MKTVPITPDEACVLMSMHGMARVLLTSVRVQNGLTLFTGAKLAKLSNKWCLLSYEPRSVDILNLQLPTLDENELHARMIKFVKQPRYSKVIEARRLLDQRELDRIEKIKNDQTVESSHQRLVGDSFVVSEHHRFLHKGSSVNWREGPKSKAQTVDV